jgi:hypothetical protein
MTVAIGSQPLAFLRAADMIISTMIVTHTAAGTPVIDLTLAGEAA